MIARHVVVYVSYLPPRRQSTAHREGLPSLSASSLPELTSQGGGGLPGGEGRSVPEPCCASGGRTQEWCAGRDWLDVTGPYSTINP